ncbi:hypothetical protein [Achromobacter dolens]|uniref:hypothetical protein n=1 Tax=Achromobacter dolens TaxID=1287738 RepID=UPI0006C5E756|nr:hypothetical protein [Achromobacter dolens]CUJ42426.1 Uncharacterised protein [Achromobacter dolens]
MTDGNDKMAAQAALSPAQIVDAFERLGWTNNDPMGQVLRLRRDDPAALGELVTRFLDRGLKHATFIDAALDLMDDATYAATLRQAWQRALRGPASEGVAEVLDSAALQRPQLFAGHWPALLAMAEAGAGGPRFNIDRAWRALDAETARAWLAQLPPTIEADSPDQLRARALLHSRQPRTVSRAWRQGFGGGVDPDAIYWLMEVGYADDGGQARALHGEQPLHIRFDAAQRKQMTASQPAWRREIQRLHPTWGSPAPDPASPMATVTAGRMGGTLAAACGLCHGPLHRLLTLPRPEVAGIDCATPLTLATCLSCQGWEQDGPILFFQHDGDGAPQAHSSQRRAEPVTPEFPAESLREADVALFQAPSRWAWQDWGDSNGRQNLSRVGGPPSWVQSADYPACPDCDQRMSFAMQLDSDLPQADGGDWMWGSGGCNYSFWCGHCRVSAHLWQCT